MTFYIDGVEVGSFTGVSAPDEDVTYVYNYPTYSNDGLTPGEHVITIVNGQSRTPSLMLLDSIVVR